MARVFLEGISVYGIFCRRAVLRLLIRLLRSLYNMLNSLCNWVYGYHITYGVMKLSTDCCYYFVYRLFGYWIIINEEQGVYYPNEFNDLLVWVPDGKTSTTVEKRNKKGELYTYIYITLKWIKLFLTLSRPIQVFLFMNCWLLLLH